MTEQEVLKLIEESDSLEHAARKIALVMQGDALPVAYVDPEEMYWIEKGAIGKVSGERLNDQMIPLFYAGMQAAKEQDAEPVGYLNPRERFEDRAFSFEQENGWAPLYLHPPAAVQVPDGWKLVPFASTSEMDIAGMDSLHNSYEGYLIDREAAEVVWNAMIAKAPAHPKANAEPPKEAE